MTPNGENNPSEILVNSVTELLIGDSPAQRAAAARNLGRTRSKIAATYLIQGLSDQAPEVRLAAVEVLGDLGDPAAIEPLSKLLDTETSPLVDRSVIMGALAALQAKSPAEAVRTDVSSFAQVSPMPVEMTASDDFSAGEDEARETINFTEIRPADVASIEMPDLPGAISLDPVAESNGKASHPGEMCFPETEDQSITMIRQPADPISAVGILRSDEGELLAGSSGHASAERQLLEDARRRSNEEASRRAAEELLRLENESETISRLQEDLDRRLSALEIAANKAREDETQLSELEVQVQAEQAIRDKAWAHFTELEVEARRQTAEAKARTAELQRRLAEEQHRAVESQRSLERMIRLQEDATSQHRAEEERVIGEQTALEEATNNLCAIRADVRVAREEAETEAHRLKEARELLRVEQEACRLAEQERLKLEAEIKHRAQEERSRLNEMRNRAEDSRRSEEEAARKRQVEEQRRLAELQAVRRGYAEEAEAQAAREQKLRNEIEALREAGRQQLTSIEEAEARRKSEEESFLKAQQQAQQRIEEARRRRSAEDSRLKSEHAAWMRMEDETRRRFAEQQQLIKDARRRAEAEKHRLQVLQDETHRAITENQQQIKEAQLNADAGVNRLSELEQVKSELEQAAKQAGQKHNELRSQIESSRQSNERQQQAVEEIKAQLLAQEERSRLLELDRLSAEEALRLKSEGDQKRLAGLDAEVAKLQELINQRSRQEADVRAEIETLKRIAADQMASIQTAEDQRKSVEQRIREGSDLLADAQEELRRKVAQEEEERAARDAAAAETEAEARAKARSEAEARAEQQRKQLEADENSLKQRTEELARRRAIVDASRRTLEDDTRRLAEVQERISAGEKAQRRAEKDRLRLEAEVKLRAEKEEERLKETREKIAAAHKQIGVLRYQADEEERELDELRSSLVSAEKDSKKRIKLKKILTAEFNVVKRNGSGGKN